MTRPDSLSSIRGYLRAAALVAALGLGPVAPCVAQSGTYEQLQTFSGVLNHIRMNYVDSVNTERLVEAAISGMLRSLDPHSYYVSRREFELRAQWDQGLLASPGLALEDADGVTTVLGVSAGGPAAKAGVQPGDRLVALNDSSVAGIGARALEVRLLGEKGSRIRLTIERGSTVQPDSFSVSFKRAIIEHHVVSVPQLAAPGVGYVRFSEFTMLGAKELLDAIRKLRGRGARSLILDLRGNPGGDVAAMVQIASAFLPERTEVFHTQGRKKNGYDQVITKEKGDFNDLPLIVLVDEGSASASEMLTGSLQDHDRALVLGRRSFGKALMQTALPLPAGDVVWLTVARVVTPSGRIIQRRYEGISSEQYRALAGKSGAAEDTSVVFHTDHGRTVRGGGGIIPDVMRPLTAALPGWF
ncbi:MAG: S41 family peptidase, partial [Gemmatimonadota bacterium]